MTLQLITHGAAGYEGEIEKFLSGAFPQIAPTNRESVLDNVAAAIFASGQLRYGPLPSPERQVAIRQVIRDFMKDERPIPIFVPFGSRKAVLGQRIDIAELMAFRQMTALQERVQRLYKPGVEIVVQLEDSTGNVLFAKDGDQSVRETTAYCNNVWTLAMVLGVEAPNGGGYIDVHPESYYITPSALNEKLAQIREPLTEYITATDLEMDKAVQLPSWRALQTLGWKGTIPTEQRRYYYDRYLAANPELSPKELRDKLVVYFSCAWARHQLNAVSGHPAWNGQYLKMQFCPPVPGTPPGMFDRSVYYRTVPLKHGQTHIPPWRGKGYLKIGDNGACPKIISWKEEQDYMRATIDLTDGERSVTLSADIITE